MAMYSYFVRLQDFSQMRKMTSAITKGLRRRRIFCLPIVYEINQSVSCN